MSPTLPLAQQLLHSTVRIECRDVSGNVSSGTGFHFRFPFNDQWMPAIVTNKHVIEDAKECTFVLTQADQDGQPTSTHVPFTITDINPNVWIWHPDPDVDLALMPLQVLLQDAGRSGIRPFYIDLNLSLVPSNEVWASLSPIEDVTIIGYPNGIWDASNNRPIVRKGVTATACNVPYLGMNQFLIDSAIYPGSSGSPVFIFQRGGSFNEGGLQMGTRLHLVGIVHAVYLHTATGELVEIDAPTSNEIAISRLPNNLGICTSASELHGFGSVIRERASRKRQ